MCCKILMFLITYTTTSCDYLFSRFIGNHLFLFINARRSLHTLLLWLWSSATRWLKKYLILRIDVFLMNDYVWVDISSWKNASWYTTDLSRIHSPIYCMGVESSMSWIGKLLHLTVMHIALIVRVAVVDWILGYELAMIIVTTSNWIKSVIVSLYLLVGSMRIMKSWSRLIHN